jgi:TPR repeat protein
MLEAHILGAGRSEEDIPGWMIPEIYFNYLRSGDPKPLKSVFYHNAMDVISLVALMEHISLLLEDPQGLGSEHGVDLIALAKLYEQMGDTHSAARLYGYGLDHEDARSEKMPRVTHLQGLHRLAGIHKRKNEWPSAIELWEQAASYQDLDAHVELAKCYEHALKDIPSAIRWTQAAISLVVESMALTTDGQPLGLYERRQKLTELGHRLERLERLEKKAQHGN